MAAWARSVKFHEEVTMELAELEKAIRTAVRGNAMQPTLAGLAGNGQVDLPPEFDAAARSLVERRQRRVTQGSTGRTATSEWF